MRDWATSGRIKIDRANEHIRYLEAEIMAFRKRRPYPVVPEPNPNDLGTAFIIHVREDVNPIWGAVAADAIHNLHVALDYLWQRAIWGSKVAKGYQFPIYGDPESAKTRFRGEPNRRMKRLVDLFFSVNAFEVGNPFCTIRDFDNADKHDTMALVAVALTGFYMDVSRMLPHIAPQHWNVLHPDGPFVIKEGAQLYAIGPSTSKMDVDHELTFEIAFGEGEILEGEAVVPTLQHFATSVESLAAACAEAGFIGHPTVHSWGVTPEWLGCVKYIGAVVRGSDQASVAAKGIPLTDHRQRCQSLRQDSNARGWAKTSSPSARALPAAHRH